MLKIKVWVTGRLADFEIELPAKRIVCTECDGTGAVLCDSLRGLALSADDMDPDFSEAYFDGNYDVCCRECNGKNVIDVVDEESLTPKMLERYYRAIDNRNAHLAEVESERRRGA